MTVPGVYSPEQGNPDAEAYSIHGVDGGVWWVYKGGEPVLPYPTKAMAELAARGMINKAARPYDATISAAAESDGVDDSRAVEVMALAMAQHDGWDKLGYYTDWARAALVALRALEGE